MIKRHFSNLEEASQAGAEDIITSAKQAIESRGRFTLALAGGSTPRYLYGLLPPRPGKHGLIGVRFSFLGGRTMCPPDHDYSNYKMAKESLIDHLPLSKDHIVRMPGELPPAQGASAYEQKILKIFSSPPKIDCLLLGMGNDGHTASLFPDSPALTEDQRLITAVAAPQSAAPKIARLTMTLPLIRLARQTIVLAGGQDKQEIIGQIETGQGQRFPISLIAEDSDWYVY